MVDIMDIVAVVQVTLVATMIRIKLNRQLVSQLANLVVRKV